MLSSPKDWLASGYFFPFKEHRIFYRQHRNKKDCVLLLHGFPTSSWDWHKLWNLLADNYRLLAPDFLGLGFSDKPCDRYSIFKQADMIEYLISEVGAVKFHILAHDYGVTVAQELVARYNAKKSSNTPYFKINSVCFLNGGLFQGAYRPLPIQKLLVGGLGRFATCFINQYSFEKSFKKIFGKETQATPQEITNFWHIINYNQGKRIIPKLIQYMKERNQHSHRWTEALVKTEVPLAFVYGVDDPISGDSMGQKFRQLLPNSKVAGLEKIGHYPHVEHPNMVALHYKSFIEKLSGPE